MAYFRIECDMYIEGEYETAEDAKQDFIDCIFEEKMDNYGRDWTDLISISEFNDKTGEWE